MSVLSQSEIDALLSNMKQGDSKETDEQKVDPFDFRTPNKFQSGFVKELSELHKAFTRVMSERMSRELRVHVVVEQISAEQLTYEGYIRSMPNPNILSILTLDPLPGQLVLEVSPQLGLVLVDRLLGGAGRPIAPRQPTQLEQTILGAILEHPLAALKETFQGVADITPNFVTSELNPQFTHAATPTEMVLALTFSLTAEAPGAATRGIITLCYPLTLLNPIREAMRHARWSGSSSHDGHTDAMVSIIESAPVELVLKTTSTKVRASDLSGLAPGDVITIDHCIDQPLIGEIEGTPALECDLGRSGPFLAARIRKWKR